MREHRAIPILSGLFFLSLSLFLCSPSASSPSALAFFQLRSTRRAREIARNERPFHLDVPVIVLVCRDSGSNPRHYVNIELTFISGFGSESGIYMTLASAIQKFRSSRVKRFSGILELANQNDRSLEIFATLNLFDLQILLQKGKFLNA